MTMPIRRATPLLLALTLALAACAGGDSAGDAAPAADSAPAEPQKATGPRVSDPEIVAIVAAANDADVRNAAVAREHSRDTAVLAFAQMMADAHTAMNGQATALATRLGVTAQESDISRELVRTQDAERTRIAQFQGAEFDKAYIDHEVAYHTQVVDAIDQILIPSATNAELKGLVEQVRPAIAAHLQRARELQARFEQ